MLVEVDSEGTLVRTVGNRILDDAQVEVAEAINEKFGITDPVHRRYNVLAWVRGYYQDRGENHGHRYEALKKAQQRLSGILGARGIG